MNRLLLLTFAFMLYFINDSFSQQLNGNWQGSIDVQGNQLNIETTFAHKDEDITGTIDIPQQGAFDIPLEQISVTESDSVFFQFKAGPGLAKFKGVLMESDKIEGDFHQRGMNFPFELIKEKSNTVK